MYNIKMIYNKLDKKHIGLILLVQSVVMIILIIYAFRGSGVQNTTVNAQANNFSEEITNDARVCLNLSPEDRPVCAKMAGIKIAQYTQNPSERLVECLKFRPYFVHDCQLGLSSE